MAKSQDEANEKKINIKCLPLGKWSGSHDVLLHCYIVHHSTKNSKLSYQQKTSSWKLTVYEVVKLASPQLTGSAHSCSKIMFSYHSV